MHARSISRRNASSAHASCPPPAARPTAFQTFEPTFVSSGLYATLLEAFADKTSAVRNAAVDAINGYVAAMNPWATSAVMPPLLHQIKTAGK